LPEKKTQKGACHRLSCTAGMIPEQRKNALSEETDKRFSMYCSGYHYCFMHGVCDIVFAH
jgi:hypothetical protein